LCDFFTGKGITTPSWVKKPHEVWQCPEVCNLLCTQKKAIVQHQVEVPTIAGLLFVKCPAIVIDSDAEMKDKALNLLICVWKDKVTYPIVTSYTHPLCG
jgi:hypothetical protein